MNQLFSLQSLHQEKRNVSMQKTKNPSATIYFVSSESLSQGLTTKAQIYINISIGDLQSAGMIWTNAALISWKP